MVSAAAMTVRQLQSAVLAAHPSPTGKSGIDRGGGLKMSTASTAAPRTEATISPGWVWPARRRPAASATARASTPGFVQQRPAHRQPAQQDEGDEVPPG